MFRPPPLEPFDPAKWQIPPYPRDIPQALNNATKNALMTVLYPPDATLDQLDYPFPELHDSLLYFFYT